VEFKRICIIGTGLIGGSLALAFKRHKIGEQIWGIDRPEICEQLKQAEIVDQAFSLDELKNVIPGADLIILAAPINQNLNLLPEIGRLATPNCLITDVGSTKKEIVSTARALFQHGAIFLGGHPMAGSAQKGFMAADPFLFENCYYVLTPTAEVPDMVVAAFSMVIEKIGAKVLLLNADLHDRIAASISHLPQILAVTLVNLAAKLDQENPYYLKMAAGGFRDMTRIASSPFTIWEDICNSNQCNILELIDSFMAELKSVRNYLQDRPIDKNHLAGYFEMAAQTRLSIPHDTKGFLIPLFDLRVVVQDEPGVIAKISSACYQEGINIRDIEVLKVRLWEGGTLRLAFESEKDRQSATRILNNLGFECRYN
jgi:prephenate dehydrogenase